MELVNEGRFSELDFLLVWIGSGVICWFFFAFFMNQVIGKEGMKSRGVKRVGAFTFIGMSILGLLSLTIVITSAIPYFEGASREGNIEKKCCE